MKNILTLLLVCIVATTQAQRWSEKMAATAMQNFWKDSILNSQRPPAGLMNRA